MSMVSWFYRSPGVNAFIDSWVSWCQLLHGFIIFVVSIVSWFHRFRDVNGLIVSWVSWFQWFHGFIGFVVS